MTDEQLLTGQLEALLTYAPYKHLIGKALKLRQDTPQYEKFGLNVTSKLQRSIFLKLDGQQIDKINLIVNVDFRGIDDRSIDAVMEGLELEFYLVADVNDSRIDRGLMLDLDDLLFYLNNYQNQRAKKENGFPSFIVNEPAPAFNFIERGRIFQKKYFHTYVGPAFDHWYENEFSELFTIASNRLAFLYRIRDRVMEEVDLIENDSDKLQMRIHPRFDNGIAEVAETIYAIWERIAFMLNEFFPLRPNEKKAPSFEGYINGKVKETGINQSQSNKHLDWFNCRLKNEHARLQSLRHPPIHYNKHRNPPGMRAIELMKSRPTRTKITIIKNKWNDELIFLKNELFLWSDGLEHGIDLLEDFAALTQISKLTSP